MFQMWKLSQAVCLCILLVLSVIDIRIRKIPAAALMLGTLGALFYRGSLGGADLWITALGAAVGGMFFIISKVTKEGIGYGDSWVILALGIYLGLWGVVSVLAGAFILLLPAGMYCFMNRKKVKTAALPFLPFLTGGYILLLLGRIGEL